MLPDKKREREKERRKRRRRETELERARRMKLQGRYVFMEAVDRALTRHLHRSINSTMNNRRWYIIEMIFST